MVRKTFNYSLLTLFLIFSAPVFSLGLGEIEVDSALNQPLNAKINLIAARAEDLEELRVELAPADVFDRVGVPRPFFLTQMKFEPILSSGGGAVIRVTSKDPVREPFLTFLVEVSWPKGRLLREYTVLLDPPEFAQQQAPQISTPTAATAEPIETPADEATQVTTAPVAKPIAPAAIQVEEPEKDIQQIRDELDKKLGLDEPESEVPAEVADDASIAEEPTAEEIEVTVAEDVADEAAPIAENESQNEDVVVPEEIPDSAENSAETTEESSPAFASGEHLTVKGDTLYALAIDANTSSAGSINQMMLAIQQANPDAFLRNNINLLKSGVVLRIPDDEAVGASSTSDAKKEIARQTTLWREYRQQVTDKMVATNVDAPDLVEDTPGETAATEQTQEASEQTDSPEETTKQELTILAGNEEVQSTGGTQTANEAVKKLENELSLSNEMAQSKGKENDELKSRIEALESILEKKEKLINIQNDQLEQLQDKVSSETEVAAAAEEQLKELQQQLENAEAAAATETETAIDEPVTEVEPEVETVVDEPVIEVEPEVEIVVDEPVIEVEPEVETVVDEPVTEVEPEVAETNVETPISPFDAGGIIAMLKKNWQVALGVPAGLLAIVLGFLAIRQRRASNAMETIDLGSLPPAEAMDDDEFDDILDETIVTPQTANNESNVFQEDFDDIDEGLENTQDIPTETSASNAAPDDVIEEADVYISYGLHQQAEDLLKESIQNEPNRQDFKVKLAEVYYSQKNEDAFETYAESVKDQLDESSNEWQNILAMGKQIAPSSALFAGAAAAAVGGMTSNAEKPVSADIDLGLDAAMSEPMSDDELEDTVVDNDEIGDDNGLDFEVEENVEETIANDFEDDLENDFEDDPVASKIMEANETSDILNFDIDDLANELEDEDEDEDDLEATQTGIMEAVSFDETSEAGMETEVSGDLEEVGMHTTMDDLKPLEMEEAALDKTVALQAEDLGTDLVDTAAAEPEETMAYKASSGDLDDLDLDNAATAAYQASETDVRSSTDLRADLEDLNADLDATAQLDVNQLDTAFLDASENAINQTATDLHELGPPSLIEEVGTKLDLAKAFADMGDSDAAKETLLEVINEGDESQIVAAKDLMNKLGS